MPPAPCRRLKGGGTMANAPSGIAGGDIALRFGAKRVQPARGWTLFTRRSVRGIFPAVHAAGKNDPASFRRHRRRKPGRGFGPFLDFSQDGRGCFAARRGRGTEVPGGVPASVEGACCPARRGAALPAGGPLRRRDEGRGTACGRFAAHAGDEGWAHTLRCAPGTRDGRGRFAARQGTGDGGAERGRDRFGPCLFESGWIGGRKVLTSLPGGRRGQSWLPGR